MPKVSVVIPAYNSGRNLDVALDSVLAQTFEDWECIVVDDGSTEDLSRVATLDPRIRLIRQPNSGVPMARNRGIAESRGSFIAFLDHDDAFLATKLERQYSVMATDDAVGLCHTSYALIDESGARGSGTITPPGDDFLSMLAYGVPFPTNTMIRRSALSIVGLFDPFLTPSEDTDLFLRVARYYKVVYIPSCEALYRVHPGNTSKNYMACYRTLRHLGERHRMAAEARGDLAARDAAREMMVYRRKRVFGPQAYDAARVSLRRREPIGFAIHLSRATWWSPSFTGRALYHSVLGIGRRRAGH